MVEAGCKLDKWGKVEKRDPAALMGRVGTGLRRLALVTLLALAGCAQPPLRPDDPRQDGLLQRSIGEVASQRPGVTDVYFVGAALWSSERVFLNEVTMVRDVVAEHYGAAGRSVILANHRSTIDTLPLASTCPCWPMRARWW